jgi:para-nitrobenzyl esterase
MDVCRKALVETRCGRLEGVFTNNLYIFKGVPYAAPPTGEFRWMPPQPCKPWAGIRPANNFGSIAPQIVFPFPGRTGKLEQQNEDCLFLNIYSPGLDGDRRPVMVWIHGGAFCMGSGSMQMYDGRALATNGNIVLVTLNYRLGFLGFLNLGEITGGKIPSTGNEGLQDQIAALQWVKENIAMFGGDPGNITVFGESAGAMSVGCLLNVPEAKGLFHRAIMESPVGEMAHLLDMSVKIAGEFIRTVHLHADDISALRTLPVKKLLQAQREVAERSGLGIALALPVVDGAVMPRVPLKSFEAGFGHRVPTLVGSNLDEEKAFMIMDRKLHKLDEEGLLNAISGFVAAEDVPRLVGIYRKTRATRGEPVTPYEIYAAVSTDIKFRKTAILIADAQCKYARGGYNYLFCWKSKMAKGALGACHGLDVGFVFGNYRAVFGENGSPADKFSKQMQDSWVTFSRTGNPSCRSLGEWPQYCDERATMILDENSRIERAFREEERQAVWKASPKLKRYNLPKQGIEACSHFRE